ncbi:MAG TPA: kelch repeat-containing protein [Gemmatimonadaceae bacterium]
MMRRLLVATLSLIATVATAQSPAPPRRAHHSLVYDEAGKRVLLRGGSTPIDGGSAFVFFNDTWAFDGKEWKKLGEAGQKLSGAQLVYDTKRNRIMSFGGYADGMSLPHLSSFDGKDWLATGQHPESRAAEPGFVYDSQRDRFVTFGGSAGRGSTLGDTWELTGTTWSKFAGASPPGRQGHVMVFDSKRNRVVLFGGAGSGGPGQPPPQFGDTWEFDGTTWTEKRVSGPGPRGAAGATFDSKRGVVVIFGGAGPQGFFGDTWSWDGSNWKKLSDTGPEPRAMGYLAYDKARDRIVLFGGRKGWPDGDLNDTWEWDGSKWTRIGP